MDILFICVGLLSAFGLGMIVGGWLTERGFRKAGLYDGRPLNRQL